MVSSPFARTGSPVAMITRAISEKLLKLSRPEWEWLRSAVVYRDATGARILRGPERIRRRALRAGSRRGGRIRLPRGGHARCRARPFPGPDSAGRGDRA